LTEALEILRAAYVEEPQHPDLRNAASWLIRCLLVLAVAGEDREENEKKALQLCEEFGFDLEERQAHALSHPHVPGPG